MTVVTTRPERENLYRCVPAGVELRSAGDDGDDTPVMTGHFAVFNQWTEINSIFEGRFLERFAPGSLKKTISENRDGMRVLFQHGFDPAIGDKPLGPIDVLREEAYGAYYEVPLLDADYVRNSVQPGLEAGLYGVSFRFRVIREEIVEEPERSDYNPDGLPERTVIEARVQEFGPVTFPAYQGASASVRSVTDELLVSRLSSDGPEKLRNLIESNSTPRAADDAPEGEETTEETDAAAEEAAAEEETVEEAPAESAGNRSHPDRGKSSPIFGAKPKTPSWRL